MTLFYNEPHPELRAAESGPIAEDNEGDSNTQDGDDTSARTSSPEMQKTPEKRESTKKQ